MLTKSLMIATTILLSNILLFGQTKDNKLSRAEKKQGWHLLFDGKSFKGWRVYRNATSTAWEVAEKQIHCKKNVSGQSDKRADLIYINKYKDFELSFEWKIAPGCNSGLMYHVTENNEHSFESGPEYQLIDNENYSYKLNDVNKTAADYDMYAPTTDASKPARTYNISKIVVNGAHREHWLNGVKVVEFEAWGSDWQEKKSKSKWKDVATYGMEKSGYICLQDHNTEIWFKNIKIKPIN